MKLIPNVIKISKLFMIILLFTLSYAGSANMIEKKDHFVKSCHLDGTIFIRQIKLTDNNQHTKQEPLLLIHGARVAGIGSFD